MTFATFAAAQVLRVVPRVQISHAVGRLCEARVPSSVSRLAASVYCKAYGVNLEEAELGQGPYRCFDEFFTRKLRAGSRPIADADVVSPADGRLEYVGDVSEDSSLRIKAQTYSVGELVGDAAAARQYAGGQACVVYLSPGDYHRVHSPVAGRVLSVRAMAGDLYPVNRIGEQHVPRLFVRNQRVSLVIETPTLGVVTLVLVGAMIVGKITVTALGSRVAPEGLTELTSPVDVAKGEEVGVFHLGSTAVLLVPPSVRLSHPIGAIRYGEALSGR